MDGRRSGSVRAEDGVGEFEEGVGPAVEAFVEGAAEVVQSIGRFHCAHHALTESFTHPSPPTQLKRKLRRLAELISRVDSLNLRPDFDPQEWAEPFKSLSE